MHPRGRAHPVPHRFLPESCTVGPGISCDDFKVVYDGTATIVLRNGMGKELDAVTVVLGTQTSSTAACNGGDDWAEGAQITCAFSGLGSGSSGSKYSADLSVSYTEAGSSVPHAKVGAVKTKLESS